MELQHEKDASGGAPAQQGAREDTRLIGLCRRCRDFVELDGALDDSAGHDRACMAFVAEQPCDEALPHLPSFNWGAFLMPPIWGAGHGQVFAVLLYPVWLLVDNLLWEAYTGTGSPLLAAIALAGTLAFMAIYARGANLLGYLRVCHTMSPEDYVARERCWTVAMAVVALGMLAFATWYNLTVRA